MKLHLESLDVRNEQVADTVWRTTHDFRIWIDGRLIVIHNPFYHDKYTIPIRNPFLKRDYRCPKKNMPAVVHDYLVRNRNLLGLSLLDCHCIFHQAMSLAELPSWRREPKYIGVVSFNWIIAGPGDGTPPRKIRKVMERINAQKTS